MEEAISGKRYKFKANILFTKMIICLKPALIEDIGCFAEYVNNIPVRQQLKIYRPKIRPITGDIRRKENSAFKRKRLLIVRDWFFYAVWGIRIRKAIKKLLKHELPNIQKSEEIKKLAANIPNSKLFNSIQNGPPSREKDKGSLNGSYVTLKFQEISVGIHRTVKEQSNNATKQKPIIEIQFIVIFKLYLIESFV